VVTRWYSGVPFLGIQRAPRNLELSELISALLSIEGSLLLRSEEGSWIQSREFSSVCYFVANTETAATAEMQI
jgi:hypothetical protein